MSETSSYSALDKLHDVLLSLYDTKEEFKTYRSFEKWAMKKIYTEMKEFIDLIGKRKR